MLSEWLKRVFKWKIKSLRREFGLPRHFPSRKIGCFVGIPSDLLREKLVVPFPKCANYLYIIYIYINVIHSLGKLAKPNK